jgi:ubiquitin carboxyl-terminal hydrolase 1
MAIPRRTIVKYVITYVIHTARKAELVKRQVIFPEFLNLDPFSTTASLGSNPSKPISSHSEDASDHSHRGRNIYRICSLVVHFGSHSYGHYVSFRRRPRSAGSTTLSHDWFRISDDNVDISSKKEMLEANPYLLFYERIDDVGNKSDSST